MIKKDIQQNEYSSMSSYNDSIYSNCAYISTMSSTSAFPTTLQNIIPSHFRNQDNSKHYLHEVSKFMKKWALVVFILGPKLDN